MVKICVKNVESKEKKALWFNLPCNVADILQVLSIHDKEYEIVDYEAPFEIGSHDLLERVNRMAELCEENKENLSYKYLGELVKNGTFSSFYEALEHVNDVVVYEECTSKKSLAKYFVDNGLIDGCNGVPSIIMDNVDYNLVGRDLWYECNLFQANDGVILEITC